MSTPSSVVEQQASQTAGSASSFTPMATAFQSQGAGVGDNKGNAELAKQKKRLEAFLAPLRGATNFLRSDLIDVLTSDECETTLPFSKSELESIERNIGHLKAAFTNACTLLEAFIISQEERKKEESKGAGAPGGL